MSKVFSRKQQSSADSTTATFCESVRQLLEELSQSDVHIIHCISSSGLIVSSDFLPLCVLKQLQYTGLLDTLKFCNFGLPASTMMRSCDLVEWAQFLDVLETEPLDEAAENLVDFLQQKLASALFSQLPEADQLHEPECAIVLGRPSDPVSHPPVVVMRNWFAQGLAMLQDCIANQVDPTDVCYFPVVALNGGLPGDSRTWLCVIGLQNSTPLGCGCLSMAWPIVGGSASGGCTAPVGKQSEHKCPT